MTATAKKVTDLRCLILNSNWQPLSTWPLSLIPAQDAISALWRERAYVVENWPDAFFRSPSTSIAVPKVAVLKEFAKTSGKPKFSRRNVLLRDHFECQYCGKRLPSEELTYDHCKPRAKGGTTCWENIVMACIPCNAAKAASSKGWTPINKPRRPTNLELIQAGFEFLPNDVREDWGSFLYWSTELKS